MKTTLSMSLFVATITSAVLLATAAETAQAAQRVTLTSNDLPFYARIEPGLIHTDGQWAAIAFYRPPECIRHDFNLLEFFDVPAAFGCNASEPYLVGFGVWKNVPVGVPPLESGLPPIQSQLQLAPNQTLPIWFVSWLELQASLEEGLTIGELTGLPSLVIGAATFYTETLHPLGAAQQPSLVIMASGVLKDGRSFEYKAIETHEALRHVHIGFQQTVEPFPPALNKNR